MSKAVRFDDYGASRSWRCATWRVRSRGLARCSGRSAPPASIPARRRSVRAWSARSSQRRSPAARARTRWRGRGGRRAREGRSRGRRGDRLSRQPRKQGEYVLVEAANLTSKPAEVPWEVAGALFVAGATGVATVRAVAPTAGEAVVIAGAGGGVGVFAVQLAVRTGRGDRGERPRRPDPAHLPARRRSSRVHRARGRPHGREDRPHPLTGRALGWRCGRIGAVDVRSVVQRADHVEGSEHDHTGHVGEGA